ELIYSRATIAPIHLKALSRKKVSATVTAVTRANDTRYATRDIVVSEGKIYCLFSGDEHSVCKYIDVYDSMGGNYLYSFKLPVYATDIAVLDKKLFVLHRFFESDDKTFSIGIYHLPNL